MMDGQLAFFDTPDEPDDSLASEPIGPRLITRASGDDASSDPPEHRLADKLDPHLGTFWDIDDHTSEIRVRDCVVAPVSSRDVDEFAKRWHYTRSGGAASWRYGLWHGVTLLGVVAYNLPTREACETVFGSEHFDKVWHMGRLVLADEAPRNSESRLIGGSLRLVQREYPHVWGVLTFAAIDAGHIGYVYQATNAIYTGTGGHTVFYIDAAGNRRATSHVSITQARAKGWSVQRGELKHRYVYVLGTPSERRSRRKLLRLESLPYPKPTQNEGEGVA